MFLSYCFSPFTLTVVSLLMLLPLHMTTHWYSDRSSVTVRHTVRTDVWCSPSDWRDACSLRSSLTKRETDSDWTANSAALLSLNHFTLISRSLAPLMVHLRSVGTSACMMLSWLIWETLGGAVEGHRREMIVPHTWRLPDKKRWSCCEVFCNSNLIRERKGCNKGSQLEIYLGHCSYGIHIRTTELWLFKDLMGDNPA